MSDGWELDWMRARRPGWEFWRAGDRFMARRDGVVLNAPSTSLSLDGQVWNSMCEQAAERHGQRRHASK